MRPLRVYVETSVFGGEFDSEFAEETKQFFRRVDAGRYRLVVSKQVDEEIAPSPDKVKVFYAAKLPSLEYLKAVPEVMKLAELYIARKVIGESKFADAMHIAYATVYNCDGVISWNFKHMVKPEKYARFNMINAASGYPQLFIVSPREAEEHEKG